MRLPDLTIVTTNNQLPKDVYHNPENFKRSLLNRVSPSLHSHPSSLFELA